MVHLFLTVWIFAVLFNHHVFWASRATNIRLFTDRVSVLESLFAEAIHNRCQARSGWS